MREGQTLKRYCDGSIAQTEEKGTGVSFDLTLPNGKHQRGFADSIETAHQQMENLHKDYVYQQYQLSRPTSFGGRSYRVLPLREDGGY